MLVFLLTSNLLRQDMNMPGLMIAVKGSHEHFCLQTGLMVGSCSQKGKLQELMMSQLQDVDIAKWMYSTKAICTANPTSKANKLIFKLVYFMILIAATMIATQSTSLMIQFLLEKQQPTATPIPINKLMISRTLILSISLICIPFYKRPNLNRKMIQFEHTHIPPMPVISNNTQIMGSTILVVVSANIPSTAITIQNTTIRHQLILMPPPPIDHALENITVNIINTKQNTINITNPHSKVFVEYELLHSI